MADKSLRKEKIEQLPNYMLNWEDIPSDVREFLLSGTEFGAHWGELTIYRGKEVIASCSYGEGNNPKDKTQFDITDCWIKGEINILK